MGSSVSVSRSGVAAKRGWRARGALLAFLFFFVKGLMWLASLTCAWLFVRKPANGPYRRLVLLPTSLSLRTCQAILPYRES
jgi:hypothetical protein